MTKQVHADVAVIGEGSGDLSVAAGAAQMGAILTPEMVVALTGLAVLALIPVLYKRFRGYAGHNVQSTLSTGD